jgi:uncharacterized cupredoxin-like copper-binding protein
MSRLLRAVVVGAVLIGTTGIGYALTAAPARAEAPLGPGLVTINVDIHYSHFTLDATRVRRGTTVRFLVRNEDPIGHEFIVGDATVHARHQQGTDLRHPPVPGEVSVGPDDTGVTFYVFDQVGEIEYACHLPGHLAYGMVGEITILP